MRAKQSKGPRIAQPRSVPVFILCGGLGTRLRPVDSRPKALVRVAGLPFLAYSLRLLRLQGFRRIHLLLGAGGKEVQAVFTGPGMGYSMEEGPAGTGGALALARDRAARVNLILNGDSYAETLYSDLLAAHAGGSGYHGVTLLACRHEDCADYGCLEIDSEGHVLEFIEKGVAGPGWINAGVYAAGGGFFQDLPSGTFSLEREVLPSLARRGLVRALRQRFFFRDIGTPSRLARAQQEFHWIRNRMEGELRFPPEGEVLEPAPSEGGPAA